MINDGTGFKCQNDLILAIVKNGLRNMWSNFEQLRCLTVWHCSIDILANSKEVLILYFSFRAGKCKEVLK